MRRLSIAVMTLVILLTACDQKQGLAGTEFENANLIPAIADSTWADFQVGMDYVMDSLKQELVAQLEEEAGRELTDEELKEMDESVAEQMEEKYAEGRHEMDSLKTMVTFLFRLSFTDEEHVKVSMVMKEPGGETTENYDGTYTLDDNRVVLKYSNNNDTLYLQDDGRQLYGKFYGNDYGLTLDRIKK